MYDLLREEYFPDIPVVRRFGKGGRRGIGRERGGGGRKENKIKDKNWVRGLYEEVGSEKKVSWKGRRE